MRAVDQLPWVLRRESFGGILFAPHDAIHVELDREAFDFLSTWLPGEREPARDEERALIRQIEEEIGVPCPGPPRHVDFDETGDEIDVEDGRPGASVDGSAYPFAVLNAPTLADFQITNRCTLGCPHCYASSHPRGEEAPLADVELACAELGANGVTQIALGGGEPLGHPDLLEILELCHAHNLVPNLTTNGLLLDSRLVAGLRRWCGAVGLSLEGVGRRFEQRRHQSFGAFQDQLDRLVAAGVPTVLQVTLSHENLIELPEIVAFCRSQPGLYGVIFLAYKPVGRGRGYHHPLAASDPREVAARLEEAFAQLAGRTRVGYDCCLTPALAGLVERIGFGPASDLLEGCSALRASIGILPNLDVVPCTFTPDRVVGNLRDQPLRDIWRGAPARAFREVLRDHGAQREICRGCPKRSACLGGCPALELVGCERHRARAPGDRRW